MSAFWYTARAILTRCFWPPLRLMPCNKETPEDGRMQVCSWFMRYQHSTTPLVQYITYCTPSLLQVANCDLGNLSCTCINAHRCVWCVVFVCVYCMCVELLDSDQPLGLLLVHTFSPISAMSPPGRISKSGPRAQALSVRS